MGPQSSCCNIFDKMLTTARVIKGAVALLATLAVPALGQAVPPTATDGGVLANPFDISQVVLNDGRWQQNQNRTLTYLKFIDTNRMLYVFRANHKLSTNGASKNGGWDDPTFPFRSHMQGHLLTAWSQCYASLKDTTCRDRATSFVAELLKCQNNNGAAGFSSGYLSGFPESDFTNLEQGKLTSGNVPYYVIHKIMAGLLDVWRNIGDNNAKTVLLSMAAWVDSRTSKLSTTQMQSVLNTEFGGMNEVLTDIYRQTGEKKWLTTAQRFDHAAVFNPLASNQDSLNGLHANTQVPKWIGAAREYMATGTSRYLDIARNAWNIVVGAHTYAIGGNSQNEHFRAPNAIAGYLTTDTCEHCNSYNMLKLTKQLWRVSPSVNYIDYYERALVNHLIGAQNPSDSHGHITYFTGLNPGGHKGLGPVWGGGTWSTDYNSFWCCQGSAVEQNTRLMDHIYGYDSSNLYLNMYAPSTLKWADKGVTITQTTDFPISDTSKFTVSGSGTFGVKVRIPSWAVAGGSQIQINGAAQSISISAGSYTNIPSRAWASGDVISVKLGVNLRLIPANDNQNLAALAYGPIVLAGNYGTATMSSAPTLQLGTVTRSSSSSSLSFTGKTSDGKSVNIGPFYDATGVNYVVYWGVSGSLPSGSSPPPASSSTGAGSSPSSATTTKPPVSSTSSAPGGDCTAALYAQCGGSGYSGCTNCASGTTCKYSNDWYSQCL
jgi:uncharacterized protein